LNKSNWILLVFVFVSTCLWWSCKPDDPCPPDCPEPNCEPHVATPYEIISPPDFPPMAIPADNPMTEEGIQLGRMLFWDPILSSDSTLACAGCHGIAGTRNSMPLFNLGWYPRFTWDGRAVTLEEQILEPVPNPIEMDLNWELAAERLNNHPDYPEHFRKAFNTCEPVDSTDVSKAIAQFLRTMISAGSKYDQATFGDGSVQLEDDELDGFFMVSGVGDNDG